MTDPAPPPPAFPPPSSPPPAFQPGQPGQPGQPPAFAPAVPAGLVVDPVSGVLIPQGTELAGIGRRIGAFFLAIPLAIVTLFVGYVIWGLVAWSKGTTPALQVLGCKAWRPDDRAVPGFWWMALRGIGRAIESIAIIGLVGFVLMCAQRDRRTIHDLVAQTVVLHDPNKVLG